MTPDARIQAEADQLEARWRDDPRWTGVTRSYAARNVVRLRGSVVPESTLARNGAERLWELLQRDEMNAGAHYLTALCREGAGAPRAAAEHDQLAAYLDPGFAMPRLHLGLLARRAGLAVAGENPTALNPTSRVR